MWIDSSDSGYPNENIAKFKNSTLIIRGDEDHLSSRRGVVELAGLIEKSNLLNVPFAGHLAFQQQKDTVSAIIGEFLRSE